jgi:hypothetical protein
MGRKNRKFVLGMLLAGLNRYVERAKHDWLSPREAAEQLGRTPEAVLARIHRDRLPAVWQGGRWWIREDVLTIIEAGRLGTKTRRI